MKKKNQRCCLRDTQLHAATTGKGSQLANDRDENDMYRNVFSWLSGWKMRFKDVLCSEVFDSRRRFSIYSYIWVSFAFCDGLLNLCVKFFLSTQCSLFCRKMWLKRMFHVRMCLSAGRRLGDFQPSNRKRVEGIFPSATFAFVKEEPKRKQKMSQSLINPARHRLFVTFWGCFVLGLLEDAVLLKILSRTRL